MPTYSYACTACDNRFDAVQAFTDDTLTTCEQCSGRLRKLFGSVGVVFKGSGFYRTDNRDATQHAHGNSATSADKSGSTEKSSNGSGSNDASSNGSSSNGSGSNDSSSNSSSSKNSSSTAGTASSNTAASG